MALTSPFRSLAAVAEHLPFHINETEKVNAAFVRWRQHDDDEARYHVELWTYCFVRRYFLIKFTRDAIYSNPADMDALIEQAYASVQAHEAAVSDTARYASWVSVVCKNAFLNFRRSAQQAVSIDQDDAPQLQGDSLEALHDAGLLHEGLCEAVERLPEFLAEIARYRFVEHLSYQEIGALTGKDLPIVRSYVNKAVQRLRKDPLFLAYLGRTEL